MTNSVMCDALSNLNVRRVFHLGVLVDHNTSAWGGRTRSCIIKEVAVSGGNTFYDDTINAGVGIGTHVDGLGHVHHNGEHHGGYTRDQVFNARGLKHLGIAENVPVFIAPFKLIDMAVYFNKQSAMVQQGVTINPGDIVMLRSGWVQHLDNAEAFNGSEPGPGPAAAEFLAGKKPIMVAGDKVALEVQEKDGWDYYPVRKILLKDHGIYIGEVFNLEELAGNHVTKGTIIISINQNAGCAQARVNPICLFE